MKYPLIIATLFFVVSIFVFIGCQQQAVDTSTNSNATSHSPLVEPTEHQRKQRERAVAAKDKLFQSLLGELTASITANGVAESIEICKTKAPELAQQVGREFNLSIGRTSFKLRNSESLPPGWALPYVEKQNDKEVNLELDQGKLALLLPIHLKEACIKCHGEPNSLSPDVTQALAKHYPNDQAIGFSEGELRGYFWIEVPPSE